MYQIIHNPDTDIVLVTISGDVTYEEIIEFHSKILTDSTLSNHLKMITDYRKSNTCHLDIKKIPDMVSFIENHFPVRFSTIHWANITITPLQTSVAYIFNNLLINKKIDYNIFTTMDAALQHVNKKTTASKSESASAHGILLQNK